MAAVARDPSASEQTPQSLLGAVRRLSLEAEPGAIAASLMKECGGMTRAQGGSVYLKEGPLLRLAASLDPGHAAPVLEFPPSGNSFLAKVERNRVPFIVLAAEAEDGIQRSPWAGQERLRAPSPLARFQKRDHGLRNFARQAASTVRCFGPGLRWHTLRVLQ